MHAVDIHCPALLCSCACQLHWLIIALNKLITFIVAVTCHSALAPSVPIVVAAAVAAS